MAMIRITEGGGGSDPLATIALVVLAIAVVTALTWWNLRHRAATRP